jgi:hypothetical protein
VRVPYLPVSTKQPIPSLAGSRFRQRPVLAVRLTGPATTKLRDGLLDTGSDDTVFSEALALLLGIDLRPALERQLVLAGRPRPVRCRYAPVQLRITDGINETYAHQQESVLQCESRSTTRAQQGCNSEEIRCELF